MGRPAARLKAVLSGVLQTGRADGTIESLNQGAEPIKTTMDRPVMYTIREAAQRLRLHEQTLRNWERAGILKLQRFGKNRSRVFRPADLDRCRLIQRYSGRGISLRGVKVLLALSSSRLNGARRS
jgi:hypothetical protein